MGLLEKLINIKVLFVLILIFMYIWAKMTGTDKTNITQITKAHIATFRNSDNDQINKSELIFFFGFPFALSLLLAYKSIISTDSINIIVTVFSIFAGLLFNLLLLIFDIKKKTKGESDEANKEANYELSKALIRETYSNISFGIFVSLFIVSMSFLFVINISNKYILFLLSLLVYFGITVFILTLLMILKRIYALLTDEFK